MYIWSKNYELDVKKKLRAKLKQKVIKQKVETNLYEPNVKKE